MVEVNLDRLIYIDFPININTKNTSTNQRRQTRKTQLKNINTLHKT